MASIKFEKFNVNDLGFEQVKLPSKDVIILPRPKGKEVPNIILSRIVLTSYGVPGLGKYFKTDKDRQFIQLPVEGETLAKFEAIDSYMKSNTTLMSIVNATEYSPIVKQGRNGPYIKLKLVTDYATGSIVTPLWISEKQTDGAIETELLNVENMNAFADAFPLHCVVNSVFRIVEVWCVNKQHGLTCKLTKANVLQPETKTVIDCRGIEF